MTASAMKPVVYPKMSLKVRRITAKAPPPYMFPMIVIGWVNLFLVVT